MKKTDIILPDAIIDILSKYYEGISTIDEERMLKNYMLEHDIPESMIADRAIMSFSIQDDTIDFSSNREIWEAIKENESKKLRLKRTIIVASSIAASIIITLSIGINLFFSDEKRDNIAVDTYSNPAEAYRAVQKYLGFTSKKLSYAYTEIKSIELLSVPGEAMKPFSEIDKNFNRLNELNRINSTSKRLERISIFSNYINVNDKN